MYSLSDPAVISQRDSLESRARALQKDLCDIRSRQNQLLPVAALCQEVLLQIFEYAAEISVKRDGTLARLRLAHVCQHWRETALAASSFWAIIRHGVHLIAGRKGLVECFLEPITVCSTASNTQPYCFWKLSCGRESTEHPESTSSLTMFMRPSH